jgi:GT2 family glycosyltransferase
VNEPAPRVTVGIVTWNSAGEIEACLEAVERQTWRATDILVADNASGDGTRGLLAGRLPAGRLHLLDRNTGFSAAHNRLIARSAGEFYLALNPDVVLAPDFVERLVAAVWRRPAVGAASGKLLRFSDEPVIDSAGIRMRSSQRHLDRGAGEPDRGQFDRLEEIFGASGAAAFYRRAMLEDLAVEGEVFDEDFFAYREDADLAWRAQWLGWRCLYVPDAVAWHGRRVTPERRGALPPEINRWSVRNRFLLRLKNQTAGHALRFLVPALIRDLQVVGYVCLKERTSLGAFGELVALLPRTWRKRRAIMTRRRASSRDVAEWFRRDARQPAG